MLHGELVALRAREAADVPVLHRAFHDDPSMFSQLNADPWRPVSVDAEDGPFVVAKPNTDAARFSVVSLADDRLVGQANVWGIDTHNRSAHLGLALLPDVRGKGLGLDLVNVLCRYGFVLRGLRRLQVETLSTNVAMIGAAQRAGFVVEGTLRSAAWVEGEVLDEVILGLLADEWPASPR